MTERKEKAMTFTDADIERAIERNLAKLNLVPDGLLKIDLDMDDGDDTDINRD